MNAWILAWRNLLRNRRRSLTTLLAIVIGACSILIFGGYSNYVILGIQTEYVSKVGHLQLQRQGYFLYGAGNPEAYGIEHYRQIMDRIRHDPELAPMINVITPTLQFGGIAGNFEAGLSRMVMGTGVVAADSARMKQWNDYAFSGAAPDYFFSLANTPEDSAIVGTGVARMLQLCQLLKPSECAAQPKKAQANDQAVPDDIAALSASAQQSTPKRSGNDIEILASNVHGAPNVVRVQVRHAQNQGVKELDDVAIQMHLPQVQKLVYGRSEPGVTAIIVQLVHTTQIPQAQARLKKLLAESFKDSAIDVLDFATLNPLYGQSVNLLHSISGFVSVLISVIVLFTIGNTMGMAVIERTTEIGTLRAMGLRASGIQRIFMAEGALLGLLGAVSGVLIALLVAAIINQSGMTYVPPGRAAPVPLQVWILASPPLVIGTMIGLFLTAVVSAWAPARRAARMDVVTALRHV